MATHVKEWIWKLKHTELSRFLDRIVPGVKIEVVYKRKLAGFKRNTYEEIPFTIDAETSPHDMIDDQSRLSIHLAEAEKALNAEQKKAE